MRLQQVPDGLGHGVPGSVMMRANPLGNSAPAGERHQGTYGADMSMAWEDDADRLLARNLFATDDRAAAEAAILGWAARQGFAATSIDAIELSVGALAIVRRKEGEPIAVKVWPPAADAEALAGQLALQLAMAGGGYPAPTLLTGLTGLGVGWAAAMTYDRSGMPTDLRRAGVRRAMATGLAQFIREAEACRGGIALPVWQPPPAPLVWPLPHNALFDLARTGHGAEW